MAQQYQGAAMGGQVGISGGMGMASDPYPQDAGAGAQVGSDMGQIAPQSKADSVDAGIADDAHFMDPNWDPSELDHDPYTLIAHGITPEDVKRTIQQPSGAPPQIPGQMPSGMPNQSSLQSMLGGLPVEQQSVISQQSIPSDTFNAPTAIPQVGPIDQDAIDAKRRKNLSAGLSALLSIGSVAAKFGTMHNTRGPELQVLQNIMASKAGQLNLGRGGGRG